MRRNLQAGAVAPAEGGQSVRKSVGVVWVELIGEHRRAIKNPGAGRGGVVIS